MHLTTFLLASTYAAAVSALTLTNNSCTAAGNYTLCQDLWGSASGTGKQNSTLISAANNAVSWSTNWTWADNSSLVKSYANVGSNKGKGMKLSAITSALTSWQWEYVTQSAGIHADVSYDIWFGVPQSANPASNGSSYEVMIWLSGLGGVVPLGTKIGQNITIGVHYWDLYSGPNQNWQVYSFYTTQGDIKNFNSDLNLFFEHLITNEGVPSSQYLQEIEAGTEAFVGSAELLVTNFDVKVDT